MSMERATIAERGRKIAVLWYGILSPHCIETDFRSSDVLAVGSCQVADPERFRGLFLLVSWCICAPEHYKGFRSLSRCYLRHRHAVDLI